MGSAVYTFPLLFVVAEEEADRMQTIKRTDWEDGSSSAPSVTPIRVGVNQGMESIGGGFLIPNANESLLGC